jgi:hypothetical protein
VQRGGENFIVDLHGLIDRFGAAPATAWLVAGLLTQGILGVSHRTPWHPLPDPRHPLRTH